MTMSPRFSIPPRMGQKLEFIEVFRRIRQVPTRETETFEGVPVFNMIEVHRAAHILAKLFHSARSPSQTWSTIKIPTTDISICLYYISWQDRRSRLPCQAPCFQSLPMAPLLYYTTIFLLQKSSILVWGGIRNNIPQ